MNLHHSPVLPGLELPVATAPSELWTRFGEVEPDRDAVRDVAQLLRGCDLQHLDPLRPVAGEDDGAARTELQELVEQCYADAFVLRPSGPPLEKKPRRKAPAPKVETPATGAKRTAEARLAAMQPSSNKRRRSEAKKAELPAPVSTEAVEAAMRYLVRKATTVGDASQADAGHSPDGEPEAVPLEVRDIQHLSSEVQRCSASLGRLSPDLLAACLSALHGSMRGSQDGRIQGWDEDDSEDVASALGSLDASISALHVMLAPGVPQQLMREDLILSILTNAKQQLQQNVLAKNQDADAEVASSKPRSKKAAGKQSYRATPAFLQLTDRLRKVLLLLARLLEAVRVEEASVLPLVRIAAETLVAPDLEALQDAAAEFITAAFRQYAEQRDLILEDMLNSILPSIPHAKAKKAAGAKAKPVTQALTLLVLRMIQDSATIPPAGSEPAHWEQALFPASRWTDYFWTFCISRCTTAKAAKADMQSDMKTVLERIVADLLAMYTQPEYPVAALMLNRLCALLGGAHGVGSPESSARQLSIDLISVAGARLYSDAQRAEADVTDEASATHTDMAARREQLLQHLAHCSRAAGDVYASARQFRLYQVFLDDVYTPSAADPEFDGGAALEDVWRLKAQHSEPCGDPLPAGEAGLLARLEALHHLGRLRAQMLKWLHSCIEAKDSGAGVRSRVVRAVSAFVQADARLLGNDHVAACFKVALEDESPSVRLESLNLLGVHIASSQEPGMADSLYSIVAASVGDTSVGVRKAAIRITWEACVLRPGFARFAEACWLLAQRACEDEESVQELVAKHFYALLFACITGGDEEVKARAAQLASIAGHISSSSDRSQPRQMLAPLEASHPLVWVLTKAASAAKADRSSDAGPALAAALLDGVISGQEGADAAEASQQRFSYLLALHALSLSDAQLCIPPENPARFVACLAPYLKGDWGGKAGQADAEQLVCVLAITGTVLQRLRAVSAALARDLEVDMVALIRVHPYQSVIAAACQAICALHRIVPEVGGQMTRLAARCTELIAQCCEQGYPEHSCRFSKRYLCALGQVLRHGASIVEEKSQAEDYQGPPLTAAQCFDSALAICHAPAAAGPLREQALRALGMIAIARPELLLAPGSRATLAAALQPGADFTMTRAALSLVLDLLKHEEGDLRGRSAAAAQQTAGRKAGRKGAAAPKSINTQNGEKDALSAGNSVLQENVDHVLRLTTCTEIACSAQTPGAERLPGMIRHGAVQVVETVERNGVLPPWTFVPHLIAVVTDAGRESGTADLALRVLKQVHAKHPEIVMRALGNGLEVAARFQQQLSSSAGAAVAEWTAAPQSAVLGLQTVYTSLLQPTKQGRSVMVAALLKRLDAACTASIAADTAPELVVICASLAAQLPWKRGDEVLPLVAGLSQTAARAGDSTLRSLKQLASQPEAASAASRGGQQAARAAFALAAVLRVVELLMTAHGLSAERVAAAQQDPERRKAEERVQFQPLAEAYQLPVSLAAFQGQPANQQYAGLKALLSTFHVRHNYLAVDRGEVQQQPELGSPQAATPAWAQSAAGKGVQSGGPRSLGTGKQPGKRPASKAKKGKGKKKPRHSWSSAESDKAQEPDSE